MPVFAASLSAWRCIVSSLLIPAPLSAWAACPSKGSCTSRSAWAVRAYTETIDGDRLDTHGAGRCGLTASCYWCTLWFTLLTHPTTAPRLIVKGVQREEIEVADLHGAGRANSAARRVAASAPALLPSVRSRWPAFVGGSQSAARGHHLARRPARDPARDRQGRQGSAASTGAVPAPGAGPRAGRGRLAVSGLQDAHR